jgi:hypothetical protein
MVKRIIQTAEINKHMKKIIHDLNVYDRLKNQNRVDRDTQTDRVKEVDKYVQKDNDNCSVCTQTDDLEDYVIT